MLKKEIIKIMFW